jgi:predicted CXXCH cytochrome family protein
MKGMCITGLNPEATDRQVHLSRSLVWLAALCVCALCVTAAPAFAYDELTPPTGKNCNDCHGLEEGETSPTVAATRKGPHGGYSTGTQKCQSCHSVHVAPAGGIMLLPGATIKDTCLSCHDGTGGEGVYGVLAARGITDIGAEHRVEVTGLVPGGDPAGGDSTESFSASNGFLTCSDCHSPHDAATVDAFYGDRVRDASEAPQSEATTLTPATNRLLRQKPRSADTSVTVYGSSWCGACHKGRLSGSAGVINHPVETETAGFAYDNISRVDGVGLLTTSMGTLGGSNFGYTMPATRTVEQAGHDPICQQCHEDARSVGDVTQGTIGAAEVFTITTPDGTTSTDNPRFQTFPHESENSAFLVEEDDDLCLNCHVPPGG